MNITPSTVWIVWDEVPFEGSTVIAVCASLAIAEQVAEAHRGTAFIEITEHEVVAPQPKDGES